MIITCEGCGRRFQLDDARIPARGARVRCKRCNHRFQVTPGGATEANQTTAGGEQTLSGATAPPGADELRFVTEPPAGAPAERTADPSAAPADEARPAEEGIGEGPWEFGDSSLSFDEANATRPPARPDVSAPADAAQESAFETTSQAFVDAIADEPEAEEPTGAPAPPPRPPSEHEEESTLRAVAPVAGAESAMFETDADAPEDEPLELESPDADAPHADAPPDDAPTVPAAAPPETAPPVAEIDGEGLEDYGAAHDAADEVFDGFDFGEEDESDPDWPEISGEMPPPAAMPHGPRPAARRRWPWWDHAAWVLPAVLLVAVLHGSVTIAPRPGPVPPGEVALGGITAENVRGRFVENARSGTLFVVSGELRSRTAQPSPAPLRVVLLDARGRALPGGAALGPALPEAALREMPAGALADRQERAAEALDASAFARGAPLAFDAVLGRIPEQAVRFRIEAGSGAEGAAAGQPARG